MLLPEKNDISELSPEDANAIKYKEVPVHETWRITCLKELIDARCGNRELSGFSMEEINDMIGYVSCY